MQDRTIFKLAWVGTVAVTPQKRAVVDGVIYEIHDVPGERSNQFLPIAFVSRLK